MYKNQLQELAQRSCFSLPSYSCIREGPDHAPRFKAIVTFNAEAFESPSFYPTLRQAEHSAAQVALSALSTRGPSLSLAARMLDETGVCKNLLQETAHRGGASLPAYTTVRSGPGHLPVFTCVVEVGGRRFAGEAARTKKQAEKNAAMAALSALKSGSSLELIPAEALTLPASGARRNVKVARGRDRSAHREAKCLGFRPQTNVSNYGASSSLFQFHSQPPSPMAGHESSTLTRAASVPSRAVFLSQPPSPMAGHESSTLTREASVPSRALCRHADRAMPAVQEDSRTRLEDCYGDERDWFPEEAVKASLRDEEANPFMLQIWGGPAQNRGLRPTPAAASVRVAGLLPSTSGDSKAPLQEHMRDEGGCHQERASKAGLRSGDARSYGPGMWSRNWGCQPAAACPSNSGMVMPVQTRALPSCRAGFEAKLEEHLKDEEEWLCGGTMKTGLGRQDTTSYTRGPWDGSPQNWNCQPEAVLSAYVSNPFQFHTVASIAPPVRVRQVATVCSAPPRRVDIASRVRHDEASESGIAVLRSLSQLHL